MATPAPKSRAPQACANGCTDKKNPKKPAVPKLVDQSDTQHSFKCPVCAMEHNVAVNQGRK